MDARSKISVIVPVHNGEQFLAECIASIKNQTIKDLEILIVDDGSTDNSREIIEQQRRDDKRIKIIANKRPSGNPGTPRNQAILLATGEKIAFVDCDDWIDKEYFQQMLTSTECDTDIIYANGFFEHLGNDCVRVAPPWHLDCPGLEKYHQTDSIWDKIYDRHFLVNNGIFLGVTAASVDVPFVIKANYYAKKRVRTNVYGYHYRRGTKGSTISLRESSDCEFVFQSYDDVFEWTAKERPGPEYMTIIYYKMAKNLIYTLGVVREKYFEEFYNKTKSYIQRADRNEFIRICKKLDDRQLISKTEMLLGMGAKDYKESSRC